MQPLSPYAPATAVPLLLLWPLSRTCRRLAHELRFYNLEAAQLDERLRPAEPDYRLMLVGGEGPDAGPDTSQWLQCFDDKAVGCGRLQDMGIGRSTSCGAAAVGTYLYAFGGESAGVEEPACMTKLPRALTYCSGVACGGHWVARVRC